jgi:hypothetical protein
VASYNANIKVFLDAQDAFNQIKQLEDRINKLKDPKVSAAARQVLGSSAPERITLQRAGRRLEVQIRLNAALKRQETLLKSLARAGAFEAKGRAKEIDDLRKVAAAAKNNLGIQNGVNAALEKILQEKREINRTDKEQARIAQQNKKSGALDQRIAQLKAVGASEEALLKIEEERLKLGNLNSTKSIDLARTQLELVRNLISEQEKLNSIALGRPGRQLADPIRGSVGTPGSPKFIENLSKQIERATQAEIKAATKVNTLKKKQEKTLFDLESKYQNELVQQKIKDQDRIAKAELKDSAQRNRVALREWDKKLRDAERQRRSRQAASPIRGTETMVGSPKYLEARQKRQEKVKNSWLKALNQINQYETKINSRRVTEDKATIKRDNQIKNNWIKALNQMENIEAGFERKRNTRSRQKSSRRNRRVSDIATGFGFPLLFGGGPGQAIAGGLGGALGGFGGSIAATAIFSQFEAVAGAAVQSGQALNSTAGSLDLVREKALFSSTEAEELSYKLEELGDVQGLATLLTEELVNKIGNKGVKALQDLGDESSETTRLWNELTLQLQTLIAGPLTDFLRIVNQVLGQVTTGARYQAFLEDLSPENRQRAEARVAELTGVSGALTGAQRNRGARARARKMSTTEAQRQVLEELGGIRPITARVPVTAADRRTIKPPKDKSKKDEERLQKRIEQLRIEAELIKQNADFKEKITAAEIAQDQMLVIRLNGEREIAKIMSDLRKELNGVTNGIERQAIMQKKVQELSAAQRDTLGQLAKFEADRERQVGDRVRNLEYEFAILSAETVEKQRQLEIEREIAALAGKYTDEQLKRIRAAKEALNVGEGQRYIFELQRQIADTEGQIVSLAQGIEGSLSSSISTAVTNLVTGAQTIEKTLADTFANIGKLFIDMAAQIIAKQLVMITLQTILKALGVGGFSFSGGSADAGASAASALGPLQAPSTPFGFAEGGYVTGPTNALIGEGGEPEYVIPRSKMRESMARYSRGARGSSVIPSQAGGGDSEMSGGTAVAAPIDVRYTVERINSVDYVTADQFQLGMQRAAQQGAAEGERRTLRSLKNSPGTRRGVGL